MISAVTFEPPLPRFSLSLRGTPPPPRLLRRALPLPAYSNNTQQHRLACNPAVAAKILAISLTTSRLSAPPPGKHARATCEKLGEDRWMCAHLSAAASSPPDGGKSLLLLRVSLPRPPRARCFRRRLSPRCPYPPPPPRPPTLTPPLPLERPPLVADGAGGEAVGALELLLDVV